MPDIETQLTNLIDQLRWNINKENEEAHYLLDDLGDLIDRLVNELEEAKAHETDHPKTDRLAS